ncbi:MAG: hypothetical protein HKN87_15360 [Saprospiraceae bacterium]|nr:hypothetical protein [Saprospiraceae bacterium]
MNGAIFFTSKYGSTEQYANWISESTGLPMFNMKDRSAHPSKFDYLILGSPIIYYKVLNHKWIAKNLSGILGKPIVFFTVSGAPAGPKLDGWIADSLPKELISEMHHIALRGRQSPAELTWYDWLMLKIGGLMNKDAEASKEELRGFDFMDHASIEPIISRVRQIQSNMLQSTI